MEYVTKNIRVNNINPGPTETELLKELRTRDAEGFKQLESKIPRRSLGRAEEVAQLALFLASDESSNITGTALAIIWWYYSLLSRAISLK
jgi:NAD(P)-dependent dehydrogenase (short-subunit alcohol dehydrogenase family)